LACYFHLFFSAVFTCPIGRLRFVVVVHNHWARFWFSRWNHLMMRIATLVCSHLTCFASWIPRCPYFSSIFFPYDNLHFQS
jgi:hypothetical protein